MDGQNVNRKRGANMEQSNHLEDFKALICRVGQEEYGIHINQVVSIERMQDITPYPNRPTHVLGITSIRNVVTPIVDLHEALIEDSLQSNDLKRIIIVQVEGNEIGLVVDAATDVLDIPVNTIQHPSLLRPEGVPYLKGISKLDNRLVILLDIEKLLEDTTNLDELKNIKHALLDFQEEERNL